MKKTILAIASIMMLAACGQEEDTKQVTIDKKGTLEMEYTQVNSDSFVVLNSHINVYNNGGSLIKTIIKNDTIPSLGMTKDTVSTEREDENGDIKDTVITHPKNYQFFSTVKPSK